MARKFVKSIRLSVPIPVNRQPRGANLSSNQAGDGWWLWVEHTKLFFQKVVKG